MKQINELYKKADYFKIVNEFNNHFEIIIPDTNILFYKNRENLFSNISQKQEYYYNPAIKYLNIYSQVPLIRVDSLKKLYKKELLYSDLEPQFWLVKTNKLEEAFLKGAGIVAIKVNDIYEYHSIRLFSLKDNIVGRIPPLKFNLFFNKCNYCEGYEKITSYSKSILMSEQGKSPLDVKYIFNKTLVVPKSTMKIFQAQQILDFSKPVQDFTAKELELYLYGIKRLGLPNKNPKSTERYFWEGLNHYLYYNRNNIKKRAKKIDLGDFHDIECKFCYYGYNIENRYYKLNGLDIVEALRELAD